MSKKGVYLPIILDNDDKNCYKHCYKNRKHNMIGNAKTG